MTVNNYHSDSISSYKNVISLPVIKGFDVRVVAKHKQIK